MAITLNRVARAERTVEPHEHFVHLPTRLWKLLLAGGARHLAGRGPRHRDHRRHDPRADGDHRRQLHGPGDDGRVRALAPARGLPDDRGGRARLPARGDAGRRVHRAAGDLPASVRERHVHRRRLDRGARQGRRAAARRPPGASPRAARRDGARRRRGRRVRRLRERRLRAAGAARERRPHLGRRDARDRGVPRRPLAVRPHHLDGADRRRACSPARAAGAFT